MDANGYVLTSLQRIIEGRHDGHKVMVFGRFIYNTGDVTKQSGLLADEAEGSAVQVDADKIDDRVLQAAARAPVDVQVVGDIKLADGTNGGGQAASSTASVTRFLSADLMSLCEPASYGQLASVLSARGEAMVQAKAAMTRNNAQAGAAARR